MRQQLYKNRAASFLETEREREQGNCWMQPQSTPIHTPVQLSTTTAPAEGEQLRHLSQGQDTAPHSHGADTTVIHSLPWLLSQCLGLPQEPVLGWECSSTFCRVQAGAAAAQLGKQKLRAEGMGWVPALTPLKVPASHTASASSPPLSLCTKITEGLPKTHNLRMAQYLKPRFPFGSTGYDSLVQPGTGV